MVYEILLSAGTTAGTAAVLAMTFYLKSTEAEDWNWYKFSRTVILSSGAAGVGILIGVDAPLILTSPLYTFAGVVIDNLLKIFTRKVLPAYRNWRDS